MAHDVYVKFGESDGKVEGTGTPLPAIEGDSSDVWHYWWCELRTCGFNLEAKEWKSEKDKDSKDKEKEKSTSQFKKVNLTKRVDWASTQLFMMCCDQAVALSTAKTDEEKKKIWIDCVTVEVCRQTGAMVKLGDQVVQEKIPFITVKYRDVRVTHYSVDMAGPEPSESLTLEFQSLEYEFQRTDPFTGLRVAKDGIVRTGKLANTTAGQAGTVTAADAPATTGTGSTGGGGPASTPTPAQVTTAGVTPFSGSVSIDFGIGGGTMD